MERDRFRTGLLCQATVFVCGCLAAVLCAAGESDSLSDAESHWAYQPIREPVLPEVSNTGWPASEIDRFVLAKLEAAGLSPSPPADRRSLIRRVYMDLIGLPPTFEQVEAFVNNPSPDAFGEVVDELLASPHYGERWGRHWLDVARYADTKDIVLIFGADRIRPYAYTYRDYVVRALNEDTPYDQFIHEQLAADQLDNGDEAWRLGAMGFLTLGRLFDNNLPDIYDDQIDTVTRGLLGLTVSCARCHDHKYDAIPTADYYSLYGVFASSEVPVNLPPIESPSTPEAEAFEKTLAEKRAAFDQFVDEQYTSILDTARLRVTDYLMKIATERPDPLDEAVFFLSLSPETLKPRIMVRWRRFLSHPDRANDPVFGLWQALMAVPADQWVENAPRVIAKWRSRPSGTNAGQINPILKDALDTTPLSTRAELASLYGSLLKEAYEKFRTIDRASDTTLDAVLNQWVSPLIDETGPIYFPRRSAYAYMPRVEIGKYRGELQAMDRLAVDSPHAPPRAMILTDSPDLIEPRVFLRGNPFQLGDVVPRRFLEVLESEDRQPFTHGSGRLDLARSITAPENPLTARVMVNRVWMHHFGEALVSTPSDFGTRSSPPTHPELLDWLAWTFVRDGWSLKKLHRRILLSRTWQQASDDRPQCRQVDPYNELLWRANRRRLDFEAMRDTLLHRSGRLDQTLGGRPVDIANDPKNSRRTIYGLVDRQSLPGVFRSFDFAVPDQSVARRSRTTVPQQALFAMNSPFMIEQAKSLVSHRDVAEKESAVDRIEALYRKVYARSASQEEVESALSFIVHADRDETREQIEGKIENKIEGQAEPLTPWEQLAQVLLMTNELMFVD